MFQQFPGGKMKKIFNVTSLLFIAVFLFCNYASAQWVETSGPNDGTVWSFYADGSNIFAATQGAGVFLSTDAGVSWANTSNGLTNPYIFAVASSGSSLFAGTTTLYGGIGGGVFISTNNGANWTLASTGLTNKNVHCFAFNGTDIFAGTDGGIFLSTNNGSSWTLAGVTSYATEALVFNGTNLFAGTAGGGVYLSTDNGSSWNPVNAGLTNTTVNALKVNGSNLYAGTGGGGVFISTDNGANWGELNGGLTNLNVEALAINGSTFVAGTYSGGVFISTDSGNNWNAANAGLTSTYVYSVAFNGANIFAGTFGSGIFRSTDTGANWSNANTGLSAGDIRTITPNPNGTGGTNLYVTTGGGGVYLSTDNGSSWENLGVTNEWVYSFAVKDNGSGGVNLFAGTMGDGVFRSTDNGANWSQINNGITVPLIWFLAVLPNGAGGTDLYAGTWGGGVFYSSDEGTTWNACSSVPGAPLISSIVYSSNYLFASSWSSGVFRSTDNGTSWIPVNAGITNTFVNSLVVSGTNIFAGTLGGIFLSTDNGNNWSSVINGLTSQQVYAFATTPYSGGGDYIIAGTASSDTYPGGVYITSDNGSSWSAISSGLTNTNIRCLGISPDGNNGPTLFAGTYGGGMWQRSLSEITPVELTSFTAIPSGNNINLKWTTATETNNKGFEVERSWKSEVGSQKWKGIGFVSGFGTTTEPKSYSYTDNDIKSGAYLYRLKQTDFDGSFQYSNIVEVDFNAPSEFALSQNYPNPFNPTTQIEYIIPSDGFVSLKVYNTLGQQVADLVDGFMKAGNHQVTFDGSKISSGVYYYRIDADNSILIKKMMLIK